ncbi:MAG: porphobilinogen synthase [Thaumarchaeota archaeon]|nr:porphobilinogen synthase [Nitrososphaerota archaeon]
MPFPAKRLRRLRRSESLRELARDTRLDASDLVCPVFVDESGGSPGIESMPGLSRGSPRDVAAEAGEIRELGIRAVMLFGIPSSKDSAGSAAHAGDGVVQRAIRDIRAAHGDALAIMADTCLCQYTDTGHCGIAGGGGEIENDASLAALSRVAVSQARAGADVVSPSAMMDGQVSAIRAALDAAGHGDVAIMSHSAKHASSFYAPFRDAASCAPQFGDRRTYQVPYTSSRAAMQEVAADIEEGVDIVMIKPALAYLDVIAEARRRFDVPVAAYSVSGEYALVKAAAERGMVDGGAVATEILHAIRRAGAGIIVTYFAREAAAALRGGQ